jgi:hypothetical protein
VGTLRLERIAVTILGLYLVGVGVRTLSTGRVLYQSYLRIPALAPLTLIVGLTLLGIALRWRRIF